MVGFESERLLAGLAPLFRRESAFIRSRTPQWQKQNGISLLCADRTWPRRFLSLMGDHLFEAAVARGFRQGGQSRVLNLAIDRKISSIFDLDDAMKVQTDQGRIMAIGKTLAAYDAIDTGIFVCSAGDFSLPRQRPAKTTTAVWLMAFV